MLVTYHILNAMPNYTHQTIKATTILEFGKTEIFMQNLAALHLHNYFVVHVCLSMRHKCWQHPVSVPISIPLDASQNVSNKSCLVCVKNEKYAYWVTFRPLGSIRQGAAKPCTMYHQARQSRAVYIRTDFSVLSSPHPPSSCVCQHTQDVPAMRLLPSSIKRGNQISAFHVICNLSSLKVARSISSTL